MTRYACGCAAALVLLSAAASPAAAQSGWHGRHFPPPNGGWLVYRINGGNPACASYNGRDCLWGQTESKIRFDRLRPLTCGADHKRKWGSTGYENPKHWCNLARTLKPATKFDNHQ